MAIERLEVEGLEAPHSLVVVCTSIADGVVVLDLDLATTLFAGLPYGVPLHMVVEGFQFLWLVAVGIVVTEVVVVVVAHGGGCWWWVLVED